MYARHTPTRMKGSGVFQGLKSLASKLHPQLPLSPKESQRLLTALTSSFREQLDETHPREFRDQNGKGKLENGDFLKTSGRGLHSSSFASADKHLASVLTNPLLTKRDGVKQPVLDYTSAKLELQKKPGKDPISLLEEYHEKGVATNEIAALCLETIWDSLKDLTAEQRREILQKTEPGKRTLLWLWKSSLHDTDAFIQNKRLINLMVRNVIEEGYEEYLWEWLKLDVTYGTQVLPPKFSNTRSTKAKIFPYRWKDFLLRSIVAAKLDVADDRSADSALDAYFRAIDLREELAKSLSPTDFPIGSAGQLLESAFKRVPVQRRTTDNERYDRFIDSLRIYNEETHIVDFKRAMLYLFHPREPSPRPVLEVLRRIMGPTPDPQETKILSRFAKPKDRKSELFHFEILIDAAHQLQKGQQMQDADWVLDKIRDLYPKLAPSIDMRLKRRKSPSQQSKTEYERENSTTDPVPFPTFA